MRSLLSFWVACLLASAAESWAVESDQTGLSRRVPARRLAAAHSNTPLKSRDTESALRHDHELHYIEGKSSDPNGLMSLLFQSQPRLSHTLSPLPLSFKCLNNTIESLTGNTAPFGARIQLSAKRPTLALESLEHHIEQIECSEEGLTLNFATLDALNEVYRHIEGINDFLLITSHEGCDLDGERNMRL